MKQEYIKIQHIPTILWGEKSDRMLIAVHGNMSHKTDTVIERLAQAAESKGYQVLSFDLPEHGDRKSEPTLCKVQICVYELQMVMEYIRMQAKEIGLFGCSIGTYFALLAYRNEPLRQALFLSPVVDMGRIIQNMMKWFSVSEEQLKSEQKISLPIGQTLYWDYYCYVKEHPISCWNVPTAILYGSDDSLCDQKIISGFADHFGCRMTVLNQGEHFFHSPEHLAFYEMWLKEALQ